ncbi:MAG TPA: hypothetical protein VIV14_05195, partial [Gammaproteobacteria bacterium]
MRYVADEELLEVVCNEASEGRSNWGGEITEAEQKVFEIDPALLERYVGSYTGIWLGVNITLDFYLEDGEFMLRRDPRYLSTGSAEAAVYSMIPLSDDTFECSCGLGFIFRGEDANGMATEVDEVHVSGAWVFTRAP